MSSKEQILAAARGCFASKQEFLDQAKTISVTLRELSRPERAAVNAKLFLAGEDGKPLTFNAKGEQDPKGDEWRFREGALVIETWLAAAMEPAFTVEELCGPDWPDSLKKSLYQQVMALNGLVIEEAAGN